MEANQLPTKPGPYYWREKDGDKWKLGNVFEHYDTRFYFETFNIAGKPVIDLQGQWLPIPTAEELVEMRAAKKMVDMVDMGEIVYSVSHITAPKSIVAIGATRQLAWRKFRLMFNMAFTGAPVNGYTCRKVRVCKEVDE